MEQLFLNVKGHKRIAVMGGTFDPIHYGHLVAAEAVRAEFNTEIVLFIPTGIQPYKQNQSVSHPEHRYLMAVLATASNPNFTVSRIEIDKKEVNYTIDTINEIISMCDLGAEVFFITGADSVLQILTWKNGDELIKKCNFVAVTRPGYNKNDLVEYAVSLKKSHSAKLHFLEIPALAISSTDIRSRIKTGSTIKYLVPHEVERYIEKSGLYLRHDFSSGILQRIKKTMSEKRYLHTVGVAKEAVKLADMYDEDAEKAYTAALLHDIAKEMPNSSKLNMARAVGIKIDEELEKMPHLLHGALGAQIAKVDFGIDDEYILDAIRYHTTGRANMTNLDKIIYLADLIEPNREIYEGLSLIRQKAYDNLDEAVHEGIKDSIAYVEKKGEPVYYLSCEALEHYEREGIVN